MPPSSVSSKNGASLTSSTSTGSPTSTGSSTSTGPSVVNLDATVENLSPGEQAGNNTIYISDNDNIVKVDEEPAPAQPVIVPVVPVIVPEPQPVIPEAIIRQYGDNVAISKCPVIGSCLQCCSRKVFNHRKPITTNNQFHLYPDRYKMCCCRIYYHISIPSSVHRMFSSGCDISKTD